VVPDWAALHPGYGARHKFDHLQRLPQPPPSS